MSSGKGRILSFFGGLVLTEATITHNEALGPYRRLSLRGEGLQAKTFEPGDKLQLLLPGDDVRTYTPITWARGETSLLVYLHGETTPAPRWAQAAAPGDILRFVGPQRSLSLPPGPVVLIGDETSIAVAAALHLARPGQVKAVLSVADEHAARAAAAAVGLPSPTLLAREANTDAHHQAIAAAARAAGAPGRSIGLCGGAALIQGVRAALRAGGVEGVKVKAYWAPGKVGLD
ncbi:MAG: siderophore-interacting protein [Deltaproteobacteria bacterium]|nr:siderophore-interacting protein [Deltaproteobacteria bacterium]